MMDFLNAIKDICLNSGFAWIAKDFGGEGWKTVVMLALSFLLIYLAIKKKFEPLLLLPIAIGILLANIPLAYLMSKYTPEVESIMKAGNLKEGLTYFLYQGISLGIYPPLIFLGIGAMTDFGPLISNPKSLLLGAAAQFGIFGTYILASVLGFIPKDAGAIAIIGGADGPTAIFVASKLSPTLLPIIAIAAYSYMALVPLIQPPIMRLLTTKKERNVVMKDLRTVSKNEKIIFPIVVMVVVGLFLPDAAVLVGMLMFGNLLRESGVCDRLSKTAQNELINILTIFLGVSVGATCSADIFLKLQTLEIIGLGLLAFSFGTAAGVLFGKLMYLVTGGKVNPLIGSAGVSAVPMAARVSQIEGQRANPANYLLMHAMGPNVAGVIGSAVAAGVLINMLG